MKLAIEIHLGNDAMQTEDDVANAVTDAFRFGGDAPLAVGDMGVLRDANGNTVGRWEIVGDG